MTKYIFTIIILAAGIADAAELEQEQLYSLANEASLLFRAGNELSVSDEQAAAEKYQAAILRYKRIIEEGQIENGYLYYNIGNGYLLRGEIGHAIANYKRAMRLGLQSPELMKNLDYARGQREDEITLRAEKKVLETLFFWHYDISERGRFIALTICWILTCIMLAWGWGKVRGLVWGGVVVGLVGLAWAGSVAATEFDKAVSIEGVIVCNSVTGRQGDGVNYPSSFEGDLHEGTEFVVLESRKDWLHVELGNGTDTWLPSEAVECVSQCVSH